MYFAKILHIVFMKKIHFIAIGGAAMHHLALALQAQGHQITGSDDEIYEPSRSLLAQHGLLPEADGWFPSRIHAELDVVIVGMHAKADNPELLQAQALGLRVESYPSFIYEESKNKQRIVIAGSHGKTSITSMILHVLKALNKPFDYLVGAKLAGFERMAQLSDAPIIVLEGDEYLASPIDRRAKFLLYQAHIALISGIAWDHINVYPTMESYLEPFRQLMQGLPKSGSLFYDGSDAAVKELLPVVAEDVSVQDYQAHPARIEQGKTILKLENGKEVPLAIFGEHMLKNLMGAKLICNQLAIEDEAFYSAISSFKGAAKRLESVIEREHTMVYKDFAHAPSKVKATTAALKAQYPKRALFACLELHTFSSLNPNFLPHYAHSLAAADHAIVYLSEHARAIKGMKQIPSELVDAAFQHPNLEVIRDKEHLIARLNKEAWEHQNLLMMSSGTFDGLDYAQLSI